MNKTYLKDKKVDPRMSQIDKIFLYFVQNLSTYTRVFRVVVHLPNFMIDSIQCQRGKYTLQADIISS
jgi:hypothetical protein